MTSSGSEFNTIVDDLYAESSDDIVGLWEVAKMVEELMGKGDAVLEESLAIVRVLLAKGLLAGNPPYSMGGYVPWADQNPDSIIQRVEQEWRELGHTPDIPDIVWFGRPEADAG